MPDALSAIPSVLTVPTAIADIIKARDARIYADNYYQTDIRKEVLNVKVLETERLLLRPFVTAGLSYRTEYSSRCQR